MNSVWQIVVFSLDFCDTCLSRRLFSVLCFSFVINFILFVCQFLSPDPPDFPTPPRPKLTSDGPNNVDHEPFPAPRLGHGGVYCREFSLRHFCWRDRMVGSKETEKVAEDGDCGASFGGVGGVGGIGGEGFGGEGWGYGGGGDWEGFEGEGCWGDGVVGG
jgi:hypothetical protein